MATIKDVAKQAGVSHGTVSNVIKGVSSVSLENVRKVEKAIKELGYTPDASARSLKMDASDKIGVVIPNITDIFYAQFFTQISRIFRSKGFEPLLYITDDVVETERTMLRSLETMKPAGMVIATCQPDNAAYFSDILPSGLPVVFIQRDPADMDCNFVGFRNDNTIASAVRELIDEDIIRISLITGPEKYTSESLCADGYRQALREANLPVDEHYIRFTNGHDSDAFIAMVHLLSLPDPPDAVICTDTQLVDGALGAMKYVPTLSPRILVLSEDTWNDNRFAGCTLLPRSSLQMCDTVAELLLNNIRQHETFLPRKILLENVGIHTQKRVQAAQALRHSKILRLAFIEGDMSDAIQSLLPDFQRSTGIEAEMSVYSHEQLYNAIYESSRCSDVDIFSVDILWLQEMASRGILANLSSVVDDKLLRELDMQPELFDDFMRLDDDIFGLPFHYCSQLLFYRRDLFENTALRRMYYEQHKTELKCPATWNEFNDVARFFTRAYNPESPTVYGTTLGCRFSNAATCEFLPRFWSYGAKLCDEKSCVTLDSPSAVEALQNYCESFKYANPLSTEYWWNEQAEEFAAGDAAMMMVYSSYVSRIADPSVSSVVGKVGVGVIPGNCSTLGGWSLCINRNSLCFDEAFAFLKWACSRELAIPSMLLGGMPASRCVYSSNEISVSYPWVRKSLEAFSMGHRRSIPGGGYDVDIKLFEEIIAKAVRDSVIGLDQPKHALQEATRQLKNLLYANS